MQRFSSLHLALIACAGTMFADYVHIGDLYYNLNANDLTAEVTEGSYIGNVIFPVSVEFNSSAYCVTSIGEYAFAGCSGLTSVTIPNSVTSIGYVAFSNCPGLTSITIPNSVTSIGEYAFARCSGLTSIEIPNSVTSSGGGAFASCSGLTNVTIGNSVTYIGTSAFEYCDGLTSITIPNSVTSIGWAAFCGCTGLTSIDIPNSVTSIGEYAFAGCTGLTSVTIPNSVTSIGTSAFEYCDGLTSVTNYATTPQTICWDVFYGVNKSSCTLYVPEGSIELYQAADGWKDFTNIQAIAETQSIGEVTNNQSRITNKIIKDKQIYILTGDKTYTVTGQQLK